jgi:hypothetical protein
LFNDFAMIQTSAQYIVLSGERQWKSIAVYCGVRLQASIRAQWQSANLKVGATIA